MADNVEVANAIDNPQLDPATPPAPESPADDNQAEESQPERRPTGGFLRRIGKLTAEKYSMQEQLQAAHARIAEYEGRNGNASQHAQQPHAQQQPRSEEGSRKFESPEELEQRIQRERIEIERRPAVERYQRNLSAAMAEAGLTIKDAEKVAIPKSIYPTLLDLDNGAEISIYLAQHPEDCERLFKMPEHIAIAYVGRLSERISPPRPVSKAPPPVKPVGAASTKSSRSLEELPQREYNRIRDAQERRHRL